MKKDDKEEQDISALVSVLAGIPNIWSATSVSSEPEKWLQSWQVYKVVKAKSFPEAFGYHLVGYDVRGHHGAVSSKIEQFDPTRMCGVTRSGRVYQLVSMPGTDPDAQYTLAGWAQGNAVVVENATDEFIRHYMIDLEHVRAMDKR